MQTTARFVTPPLSLPDAGSVHIVTFFSQPAPTPLRDLMALADATYVAGQAVAVHLVLPPVKIQKCTIVPNSPSDCEIEISQPLTAYFPHSNNESVDPKIRNQVNLRLLRGGLYGTVGLYLRRMVLGQRWDMHEQLAEQEAASDPEVKWLLAFSHCFQPRQRFLERLDELTHRFCNDPRIGMVVTELAAILQQRMVMEGEEVHREIAMRLGEVQCLADLGPEWR